MVDEALRRRAVDTVWSLYRAKHRDVDAAEQPALSACSATFTGSGKRAWSEVEELTGFGLA